MKKILAGGQAERYRCVPMFGCGGKGWVWDSSDSGSGAQCYCDCPAGDELKTKDDAEREEKVRQMSEVEAGYGAVANLVGKGGSK